MPARSCFSGGVDCWGNNGDGQLGNGVTGGPDNGGYDTAQPVIGISNAVTLTDLAYSGYYSYCSVLTSGSVDCWGDNSFGQLGNGTTGGPDGLGGERAYDTPQRVAGLTDATSVASDGDAFCALLTSGSLDCWGDNGAGQLGNAQQAGPDECPGRVPRHPRPVMTITNAVQVVGELYDSSGGFYAVLASGGVDCWGDGRRKANLASGP